MRTKALKAVTLMGFVALISLFVAYRSGWIMDHANQPLPFNPNGTVLSAGQDTTRLPSDSIKQQRELIPSSKSVIIREPVFRKNKPKSLKYDTLKKKPSSGKDLYIYSSKSGVIVNPEDIEKVKGDSLSQDSVKNKQ